ncbi:hypothetical protein SynBIOSU31_01407 [Synechococcus sp. BIOS-U3-1]|nr:hypothetical protein SynBIOSU31_01407 [Synechococcus sp. BIOS-U3-1]
MGAIILLEFVDNIDVLGQSICQDCLKLNRLINKSNHSKKSFL